MINVDFDLIHEWIIQMNHYPNIHWITHRLHLDHSALSLLVSLFFHLSCIALTIFHMASYKCFHLKYLV